MKKSDNPGKLFQDAERLKPSLGLWRRISERSPLAASGAPERSIWAGPMLRAAAVIALAATVLGLAVFGLSRRHAGDRQAEMIASAAADEATLADSEAVIDTELLSWQADLGELDLEAEEAGEVL